MAFLCNGSNHRTGIKNEVYMTQRFGQDLTNKIFPDITTEFIAEQRGGTAYKEDGVILDKVTGAVLKRLSYKKKEKTKSGTFDWVNTTSYITEEKKKGSKSIQALSDVIDLAKTTKQTSVVTDEVVEQFRHKVHQATEVTLNNFESDDIRSMIKTLMIDSNKDIHVTVTTLDTDNIYYFPFSDHNIINLVEDANVEFTLRKKSKKAFCDSRTVMASIIDPVTGLTKMIDTGIRIRLHLNNGVSAMLGVSNTNPTSVFCVKFQQDNFQEIIKIAKIYQ
jgi:hypothetical protein